MGKYAANTTIIRDDFGVPHIYGKTDADAVFGLLYAQCEDDFKRVERNYTWAIGRLAEVEGESQLYSDLRANLFMTQEEAIAQYNSSPDWLKKLCEAFADGINYYLYTHPEVKPKLLTRFEPWMPLYFFERVLLEVILNRFQSVLKNFMNLIKKSRQLNPNPFLRSPRDRMISGKLTQSGNAISC